MELSDNEKWEGAKLSAQNGINLFKSAEAIASIGQYGHASALMVLSSEEIAKALSLSTSVLGEGPLGKTKKVFRDHAYKHNAGAFYLLLTYVADKAPIHLKDIEQDSNISIKNHPKELMKRMKQEIAKVIDDSRGIIDWQKKADMYKKNGFYVDYYKGKWKTPDDILEEDFNSLRIRAIRLIQIMDILIADNSLESYKKTKSELEAISKGYKKEC